MKILFYAILFSFELGQAASILDLISSKPKDSKNVLVSNEVAEKTNKLKLLEDEKSKVEKEHEDSKTNIESDLEKINSSIKKNEYAQKQFYSKLYTEIIIRQKDTAQVLNESLITEKSILENIETEIKLLNEYIKDPYFHNSRLDQQSYFSFDQLYNYSQKVVDQEDNYNRLLEEKNTLDNQQEALKREVNNIEKEIKDLDKKQKDSLALKNGGDDQIQLNEAKIQYLKSKKYLTELKLKDSNAKESLLNSKTFIAQTKLALFKKDLRTIQRKLRVYESDIEKFNTELNSLKENTNDNQRKLNEQIQDLSKEKNHISEMIAKTIKEYNITPERVNGIKELSLSPELWDDNTFRAALLLFEEDSIQEKISAIKGEKENLSDLLEVKELFKNILLTWQKITQEKFQTEEEIAKTKVELEDKKLSIDRNIDLYQEKINNITRATNNKVRLLNNIKEITNNLKEKKYGPEIEKKIESTISALSSITKTYSGSIDLYKDLQLQLNAVVSTLEKIGGNILSRSEYAVSLNSLKAIVPELRLFASDFKNIIKNLIKSISLTNISKQARNKPIDTLIFILQLLFIIGLGLLIYYILKKRLPALSKKISALNPPSKLISLIYELSGILMLFIHNYLVSLTIWGTSLLLIQLEYVHKTEFKILFYLISIPYSCYIIFNFLNFLINFNKNHHYSIISEGFQKRFYAVSLFFLSSTVSIFLFKEAFALSTYEKTELLTILDVVYSIILRACIIFFIGKDEMLSLIPESSKNWIKFKNIVSKVYYIILASILIVIIVSDPYIGGFGRLVSYILRGTLGTIALFGVLYWIQKKIRKFSANIFFSINEDSSKERFDNAKTFYGIFIIITFIAFVIVTIYLGAKLWGHPISQDAINNILNIKLFSALGENNQYIPITVMSIITLGMFIVGGLLSAWIFDNFVLDRIFKILMIDNGVQNTVSSISSYVIFLAATIVGLMRIGMSGTTMSYFLGALAVALAFAVKGPANDFIGYFILLVERSVKIGDFVEFTNPGTQPITGFVRKITPRTLVLRRKNSVTVIVPNSLAINSTFYNWSYSNTFFAFDDIFITVTYNNNPEEVRRLLQSILNDNRDILKSPAPVIRLFELNSMGCTFQIRGFLSSVNIIRQWDIASDVRIAILTKFKEKGISIAMPTRYVVSTNIDNIYEKGPADPINIEPKEPTPKE